MYNIYVKKLLINIFFNLFSLAFNVLPGRKFETPMYIDL